MLYIQAKKVIVEEFFDGPSLRDHRKKKREVGSLSLLLKTMQLLERFYLKIIRLIKF
jgi:hypothetical protein